MASRGCLHPAEAFCYVCASVCGQFIKHKGKSEKVLCESLCQKMREAYKAYFSMPVGYQDKSWAPHFTGISHLQEKAASPDSEEDIGDPDYGFTDVVEERRPY